MCGICGIINLDGTRLDARVLIEMNNTMRHRGPDDEGYLLVDTLSGQIISCFGDETVPELKGQLPPIEDYTGTNMGLGFRRLSIVDLSPKGHQPMKALLADVWIVYNGEIYNYKELKEELIQEGFSFSSKTDTEVILNAYLKWGLNCTKKFNGMWAFAIWDARKKLLFCSRDRFGIKPFYYVYTPHKEFIFASEIKAIAKIRKLSPNTRTLHDFLYYGLSDHTEQTMFSGVFQLRGGHCLLLKDGDLSTFCFYDLRRHAGATPSKDPASDFREKFFDSVSLRLRSDVPVGFALSGGIDSSSIVLAAHSLYTGDNFATFSTCYPGSQVDESYYMKKVIDKTQCANYQIEPTAQMYLDLLDKFVWHQEEPVNGASYFGEFVLRRLIRQTGTTVSLDGQGADEIITGYKSFLTPYLQDLLKESKIHSFLKECAAFKHMVSAKDIIGSILGILHPVLAYKMQEFYLQRIKSYLSGPFASSNKMSNPTALSPKCFDSELNKRLYESLTISSLPVQLIRADKSAMAFSVECRFPFLDHRLVELIFSLPSDYKIRDGVTKYILRESMKKELPKEIYARRDKKGFPVPQSRWLRGELRTFTEDIINCKGFKELPFINWKKFVKRYQRFLKCDIEFDTELWSVISVFLWTTRFNLSF